MEIVILILILCIITLSYIIYDFYIKNKELKNEISKFDFKSKKIEKEKEKYKKDKENLEFELQILKSIEKDNLKQIIGNDLKIKSTFKGKKVLIGDYMKEMIEHTRKIFLSLGFEVDVVNSGEAIVHKINEGNRYDVIVTNNIYQKKMEGTDVLNELKQIIDFNTPVVVLTISRNERNRFIYEYGFDGYLEKMLTQEAAIKEMQRLLKNKINKKQLK